MPVTDSETRSPHVSNGEGMRFKDYDGFGSMKIIQPYNALRYSETDLYRSRPKPPMEIEEVMFRKGKQLEADLFFGGATSFTCSAPANWNQEPPLSLRELAEMAEKYRRPRLYVQSLESCALRDLIERITPRFIHLLEVKETSVLSRPPVGPTLFGHLKPGLYGCGKDYYLVENGTDEREVIDAPKK